VISGIQTQVLAIETSEQICELIVDLTGSDALSEIGGAYGLGDPIWQN
jgi:hypothetical protein